MECEGSELELLLCSYLSETHEDVSQCDSSETAAVTCQGKLSLGSTATAFSTIDKPLLTVWRKRKLSPAQVS